MAAPNPATALVVTFSLEMQAPYCENPILKHVNEKSVNGCI